MRDPRDVLPLKPLVFEVLLLLAAGDRHGWSLARGLEERTGGARILPGNLYRLLKAMRREGLIEEAEPSRAERAQAEADTGGNAERRRYYALTTFGRECARAEAHRLEALVHESRAHRLLATRRPAR